MKNNYEIRGEITIIYLKRRDGTILETIIDTDDLNKAKEIPGAWYALWDEAVKGFYVRSTIKSKKICYILHRWLTDALKGVPIDHINHNTLDNRRSCNLREVTASQNTQNSKRLQARNKSGVRGVCWDKCRGKWRAQVFLNGKHVYRVHFTSLIEAEIAVIAARKIYMPYCQEA